ncbi:hypothetical protein [Seonamhaeicola sp.]|nr:hypothetical protein [Seonamhaeicola sp.]
MLINLSYDPDGNSAGELSSGAITGIFMWEIMINLLIPLKCF